ncbi:lysophospholipase [Saccharomycopsis crataegensis]|uniref:Lysophospholipase n=1 Tax=Saccharomycopsis crataegensis TaxID=43959 RepID=A0AAV5QF51_9ASCO|nr:lysophospholipase [Saccharomycopsis crataegensis]
MIVSLASALLLISPAFAWSPTDSYAPGSLSCPANVSLVREASGLSTNESDWLTKRHANTDQALKDFLTYNISLTDFDVDTFFNSLNKSINVGLAFSGGGYRAMTCGAGQLAALDNRTTNAFENGLGGLLQAATYLAGLSGGNWLTGTISFNNFTSVEDILNNGSIWDLSHAIYNPGGVNLFKTASVFDSMADDIEAKEDAGFNTSITDIWARALSHQFFDDPLYGAALTFSTLRDAPVFQNGEMPFPISVSDGRYPQTKIISSNSTVFEFNPFEMGSWDPYLNAFTDIKYLGTNVTNGQSNITGQCIGGFDNAGFIMGTSSSLFNQFLLQLNSTGLSGTLYTLAEKILSSIDSSDNDIADYTPNPFYKTTHGSSNSLSDSEHLYLVDGGEDLQNIPLAPLIEPKRELDVIFAFDNSADTDQYWPNGTSMVYTYQRQFTDANGSAFPYVPDMHTFRAANMTAKPAFFGCDASNLTDLSSIPPLVVYVANRPFSYWSNTSTFKMSYEEDEKRGMITNGFEVASRLNRTLDSTWKECVACAIIRRSQERLNQAQTAQCQACFEEYCWNGDYVETDVGINFTNNGTTNGDEENYNATSGAGSLYGKSELNMKWVAVFGLVVVGLLI